MSFFTPTLFTAACPAEKGECESTWWAAGSWPRPNHHLMKSKVLSINDHFSLSNAESKLTTAIYETEKISIHLGSSVVWMDLPRSPAGGYFLPFE